MITTIVGEDHKDIKTKKERKSVYWEVEDFEDEFLDNEDPDDALTEYFDNVPDELLSEIPDEITLVGYSPMVIQEHYLSGVLDRAIEHLDDEFGNPDGSSFKPSDSLLAAERAFIRAIIEEYEPWACEKTGEKMVVNMREWVLKNFPEEYDKCFSPKKTEPMVMHVQ